MKFTFLDDNECEISTHDFIKDCDEVECILTTCKEQNIDWTVVRFDGEEIHHSDIFTNYFITSTPIRPDYYNNVIKAYIAVQEIFEDYECVDNIRIALVGDEYDEARYKKQIAYGCCGLQHRIITIGDEEWMIGFNYGH